MDRKKQIGLVLDLLVAIAITDNWSYERLERVTDQVGIRKSHLGSVAEATYNGIRRRA